MNGRNLIQRVPVGVLDGLGMKGTGELPKQLAETIVGTYDMTCFYHLNQTRSSVNTSAAINALADWSCNIIVGNGELWLVTNYTIRILTTLAAGTSYELVPYFFRRSQGSLVFNLPARLSATTGQRGAASVQFAPSAPLIMAPGDGFGVTCVAGTFGTPVTVEGRVDFAFLSI